MGPVSSSEDGCRHDWLYHDNIMIFIYDDDNFKERKLICEILPKKSEGIFSELEVEGVMQII